MQKKCKNKIKKIVYFILLKAANGIGYTTTKKKNIYIYMTVQSSTRATFCYAMVIEIVDFSVTKLP
jgi:hypothetical protein